MAIKKHKSFSYVLKALHLLSTIKYCNKKISEIKSRFS